MGRHGLVFTTLKRGKDRKVGTVVNPGNVLRVLYDVLDAAKLPRTRFHDLRHSAASGTSATLDTRWASNCSAFGNTSAAATINVQFSADNSTFTRRR